MHRIVARSGADGLPGGAGEEGRGAGGRGRHGWKMPPRVGHAAVGGGAPGPAVWPAARTGHVAERRSGSPAAPSPGPRARQAQAGTGRGVWAVDPFGRATVGAAAAGADPAGDAGAAAGAPAARLSLTALRGVVFVAGAGTMAIEMAAARMLAPSFGTSQFVWAALIGVVLLALAVGYRVGGRLADRHPGTAGLFGSLVAAGILAAMLPLAGRWADAVLARGLTATPVSVILLSLAAVLLLVAPPVLPLAFATPFALRLGVAQGGTAAAGTVVGSLEAWATAGSICGTFVPAFLTIPFCGTDQTLLGIATLLVATGALGLAWPAAWLAVLVPVALLPALSGPVLARPGLIYETETPYQFVQVVRQSGLTELLVNDGAGVQSAWRRGSDLTGMYFDAYALLPELRPGRARSVLVIGAGGGTILR